MWAGIYYTFTNINKMNSKMSHHVVWHKFTIASEAPIVATFKHRLKDGDSSLIWNTGNFHPKQHNIPEDSILHSHCPDNLKSHTSALLHTVLREVYMFSSIHVPSSSSAMLNIKC